MLKILSIPEEIIVQETIRDKNIGFRIIPASIIIYTVKCENP